MYNRPTAIVTASVLAAAGGLISLVLAFILFDPQADGVLQTTGVLLLISVMFLGLAGNMMAKGQQPWIVTMVMIFLCASVAVGANAFGMLDFVYGALLVAIALATAVLAAADRSELWLS